MMIYIPIEALFNHAQNYDKKGKKLDITLKTRHASQVERYNTYKR